ncbi:helix-turn-helix domain-containing protein [Rhodopseudomonas palustris]|uniref:XRE family transcriptional regulator n=1 Tax=Rhodopseudomonas palustris TaxID=1076 RepID=UPI0022F06E84|nr:XRE family transcriptional regulator [Rhodopseudomonas palustris]WBU27538.1 helix-turn-helix domain-containing protein [Rhodopseudomonas palustris]
MKAVDGDGIKRLCLGMPMEDLASRIKHVRKTAKLSQERFAETLGKVDGQKITRGAVGNWELGGGISRENLRAIASTFKVRLDWLELGIGSPTETGADATELTTVTPPLIPESNPAGTSEKLANNARIGELVDGFTRVPVRGQGMGGNYGALLFDSEQNMGDVLAPPVLHGVPGAYAVYVVGDSMLERFRDGEVVFVHPYLRPRKDDDCVIQIRTGEHGERTGWIKRFVSWDEKTLKVRQLNPKKVITFKSKDVVSVHRIVMSGPI